MSMYAVIVRMEARPEKVDEIVALAAHNARESRKEPGNLQFDLLRSSGNPLQFVLMEVYQDEAAFKEHQKTAHYARWKAEIPGLLAQPRVSDKYNVLTPGKQG
jgi:autoinducer 2-degrading protein